MPGDGSQRGGSPFIFRKLRPELKSDKPAPPLLPAAPRPADLKRHVSEMLGEGLRERLGVSHYGRLTLSPGRVFLPNAEWVCAQLDGESVLLNLRVCSEGVVSGVELKISKKDTNMVVTWPTSATSLMLTNEQSVTSPAFLEDEGVRPGAPGERAIDVSTLLIAPVCQGQELSNCRGRGKGVDYLVVWPNTHVVCK